MNELREVGKIYRTFHAVRIILNQRGWLEYLRREAVTRALRSGIADEPLANAHVIEGARKFCDVLDQTSIEIESLNEISNKATRWGREKVTRGVRFPDYSGKSEETFFTRLQEWVESAARSDEGQFALDHAGYPRVERRANIFAVAVATEILGLLGEPHGNPGWNQARWEMTRALLPSTPDLEIRKKHANWRLWTRAVVAGLVTGITSDIVFNLSITEALSVGFTVLSGTAVAEFTQNKTLLTADVLAVRRQVGKWLGSLPRRIIRFMHWRDDQSWRAEEVMLSANPFRELMASMARGYAQFPYLDEDVGGILSDVEHLIRQAGSVNDIELRGCLIEVQTALKYDEDEIPVAFVRLVSLIEDQVDVGRTPAIRQIPNRDPGALP
ncbi:hypothetical protein [Streptomyces cylindrosporus]|uniref:Uncharacterized protein n=1 Tax=Streptomyces cylindrosporus TaxID=2927583 RepID=A0ABS9YH18_9ACTN|nr:hypothetical protein [Streptomyces cylindrosporus]MCI3276239.1 hypothetical protein [Streptomyces cylindrosporus]